MSIVEESIGDEIIGVIRKRKRAPTSQILYNHFSMHSRRVKHSGREVDDALTLLVKSGQLQCVGGGLERAEGIQAADAGKPRAYRAEAPQAADAFRVGLR